MGLQWVLSDATVVLARIHKRTRCIHLLHESWNLYEEIANASFCNVCEHEEDSVVRWYEPSNDEADNRLNSGSVAKHKRE